MLKLSDWTVFIAMRIVLAVPADTSLHLQASIIDNVYYSLLNNFFVSIIYHQVQWPIFIVSLNAFQLAVSCRTRSL